MCTAPSKPPFETSFDAFRHFDAFEKIYCVFVSTATPAIHYLRKHDVRFTEHPYRYEEHGGTRVSSRELGVDEHAVIKTLVMEDESRAPLMVLMHGDREVSTKQLARQAARKTITPCDAAVAQKHTGYLVGGTSPFGTRKPLPVYMERSILDLDRIYINGGRRGFLVAVEPAEVVRILKPELVDVAL
jgi:Cys-tRNA(Pro) deacylase